MTETTINPYHPSGSAELDFALEPLRFNGIIHRADYHQMLPRNEGEWQLYLVLGILLATGLLAFGAVILFEFSQGELRTGFVFMAHLGF